MRLLIVEDEKVLADSLKEFFIREKYIVDVVYDGLEGLDEALTDIYDVIILDVMLPNMNGFDIIKNLREEQIMTPTIMLSAMSQTEDKIEGLNYGADDYLTKPFQIKELLARVNALSRRGNLRYVDSLTFEDITLNKQALEISTKQNHIRLSSKEFLLLEYLIKNNNQIIDREQIAEKLWGLDNDSEYNNVEVYISFLRKKLKFINSQVKIKAIRNMGYKMEIEL